MSLKKLSGPEFVCTSLEHDPPSHIVLSPGTYEHKCPMCGHMVVFTVGLVSL